MYLYIHIYVYIYIYVNIQMYVCTHIYHNWVGTAGGMNQSMAPIMPRASPPAASSGVCVSLCARVRTIWLRLVCLCLCVHVCVCWVCMDAVYVFVCSVVVRTTAWCCSACCSVRCNQCDMMCCTFACAVYAPSKRHLFLLSLKVDFRLQWPPLVQTVPQTRTDRTMFTINPFCSIQ